MLCWSLYDAPIYVYVYVYECANLLNLSSLRNVQKDTFAFFVYVYVATAKGLYCVSLYVHTISASLKFATRVVALIVYRYTFIPYQPRLSLPHALLLLLCIVIRSYHLSLA